MTTPDLTGKDCKKWYHILGWYLLGMVIVNILISMILGLFGPDESKMTEIEKKNTLKGKYSDILTRVASVVLTVYAIYYWYNQEKWGCITDERRAVLNSQLAQQNQ